VDHRLGLDGLPGRYIRCHKWTGIQYHDVDADLETYTCSFAVIGMRFSDCKFFIDVELDSQGHVPLSFVGYH
jgi:hypothetical protein